jgi:ubiquinone/menaquinone biosynthesis C-methylase UbiE
MNQYQMRELGMADEITRRSNEAWEAAAPAWELYRDRIFGATRAISERLVDLIDVGPGGTVLEIAAGTGETGFLLAERLRAGGQLISTDFSEAMVRAARRGASARGLDGVVECRMMDAQKMDLPDGVVDGVLSRFGLMLVADQSRTLSEAKRVLRSGGRLAYAVWGMPDANPWITLLAGALIQRGHALMGDPFGAGGMFSMGDLELNLQLVNDAGFTKIKAEELSGAMRADNVDDYWDYQTSISGPIAVLLASLPSDERHAAQSAFRSIAEPYRTGAGLELPFQALLVHATR